MRVSIDSDRCVSAGQCVMLAPDVFDQDDDGIVMLLQDEPPEDLHAVVRQSASLCPVRLIQLSE
ncbi:ferredoxin [Kitasatospora sp. NPDC056138]|uniref:ferredoxin n=1 Tax=Kitasatospora sp. NPDC056138 TaxID=3345724 RepID=UPI0035E09767